VWRFLKKLKLELLYDPTIPFSFETNENENTIYQSLWDGRAGEK
jgi:hypothetical protein